MMPKNGWRKDYPDFDGPSCPIAGPGCPSPNLLAWFSEDERQVCQSCGERSAVSVPDALASFCLRCGAVALDGVRVDVDGRITV